MKKIQLIEAVQSFFQSDLAGDQKAIYHPEDIKVHLNNAFNQLLISTYLNGKKTGEVEQLDSWHKTYECQVLNQIGNKAYIFLPFAPVQLPDWVGVHAVYDHANPSVMLAPVESDAAIIFDELEVGRMDTTPTYYLEQNNMNTGAGEASHVLRLDKLPVAPNTLITSLDVEMVQNLEQVDDFDEITIPSEQGDALIRQVIDIISKKAAPDTSNDAVAKTPNSTTP